MSGIEFVLAVAAGIVATVLVGKTVYNKIINKKKTNNVIKQKGNQNTAYQNSNVNNDKRGKKGEE